ncbi:MAG: nucleotide sugar dehydrogenase, partial [Desulfobacula sp.]|nr:nucleotide sugar dehydrogenase [Desulfobacula sp.]
DLKDLSALIFAVPHREYLNNKLSDFKNMLLPNGCFIDVKSVFDPKDAKELELNYWRL